MWCGNLGAVKALVEVLGGIQSAGNIRAERDGATPLHWAACGVKPQRFGCGGNLKLCRWLIEDCGLSIGERMNLVNAVTKDGNSILMWASWSGSLNIVRLLLEHKADPTLRNRNGCSIAHWAASGGDLDLCKFLANEIAVPFNVVNHAGNSPLLHAVAYGRQEVISWLLDMEGENGDDRRAVDLAKEFVEWSAGDPKRKDIFELFTT